MPALRPAAFAALCLAGAASCGEYTFVEQDLTVQHDPEADRLVLTVHTRDIGPGAPQENMAQTTEVEAERLREEARDFAVNRVRAAAAGARTLRLFFWWDDLDLDPVPGSGQSLFEKMAASLASEKVETDAEDAPPWLLQAWSELDEAIRVTDAGIYEDDGSLCLFQRVELRNVQHSVGVLNGLIHRIVGESLAQPSRVYPPPNASLPPSARRPWGSEAGRAALAAFVEAKEPWIVIGEEGIDLRLPLTAADRAVLFKLAFADHGLALLSASDDPHPIVAPIASALFFDLAEIRTGGDVTSFRFEFDARRRIRITFMDRPPKTPSDLAGHFTPDELPRLSRREVTARLEAGD